MRSKISAILVAFTAIVLVAASCKKKDDPAPGPDNNNTNNNTTSVGEVGFEFTNYVGNNQLAINTDTYVTPANDSFIVTKFNYYISNIHIVKSDGTEYIEPESYHLVQHNLASSKHFHLANVPAGTYTAVSFLIGVDSARNESGAQTGALDPINGMFWTWNTGYIMAKLEGTSPQSMGSGKSFTYHIGGYKGQFTGVRKVTLTFSEPMKLTANSEGTLAIKADALKWFSPNNISIAANYQVMSADAVSHRIADNYANMFTLTNVLVSIP